MATVDKKYLDLTGLQKLVQKKALVVHPTVTTPVSTASAIKIKVDANGHVIPGDTIAPSDIGAATAGHTHSYSEILNPPTIGNGTLTIMAGVSQDSATSKGTFGANQTTSTTVYITAADLGVTSAMHFRGVIEGSVLPATTNYDEGDVIILGGTGKEYVLASNGSGGAKKWNELGDEGSFALKTTTITAGTGLTGGGDLSQNRTISLATDGTAADPAAVKVGRDAYGRAVLGAALATGSTGAHTHTVDLAASKVVTSVSSTSANYTWTIDKGTNNANVKSVLTSYSPATNKLNTTSITGVSGSTTASKATALTAVAVATAGTAVVYGTADKGAAVTVATLKSNSANIGNASVDTAVSGLVNGFNKTVYHAEYDSTGEMLKLSSVTPSTTSVVPAKASGSTIGDFIGTTSINPAVDAPTTQKIIPAVANGSITPYSFADITVPVAASATTVATGSVSGTGAGDTVVTGLGTPNTVDVLGSATAIAVGTTTSGGTKLVTAVTPSKDSVSGAGTATSAGDHTHTIS